MAWHIAKATTVLAWAALSVVAQGQYWQGLDGGIPNTPGHVNVVYGDSVWDKLLVGGNFRWITADTNSLEARGILKWDGQEWDTLPSPIEDCGGNICGDVWDLMRYQGQLYANGSFILETSDSIANRYYARWDEGLQQWVALDCINPVVGGASTLKVSEDGSTMYSLGYRNNFCGLPSACVFENTGDGFHSFAPWNAWPSTYNDYLGFVFKYQDMYYMSGLVTDSTTQDWYTFLRFNGSTWEPVPGWNTVGPIKDVLIYEGKLYVCGYFFTSEGAPGNMVAVYDGTSWSGLGTGLQYYPTPTTYGIAYDLLGWNGDVYVAGQFFYAGGVQANCVARWDGDRWCGLGGIFAYGPQHGQASSLTVWRDSLYMAGAFHTIDGDSVFNVAKWLGQVETCSEPMGLPEVLNTNHSLTPRLVDPDGVWMFDLPSNSGWAVTVFDAQGRRSFPDGTYSGELDLRELPHGVYLVMCTSRSGEVRSAKVVK